MRRDNVVGQRQADQVDEGFQIALAPGTDQSDAERGHVLPFSGPACWSAARHVPCQIAARQRLFRTTVPSCARCCARSLPHTQRAVTTERAVLPATDLKTKTGAGLLLSSFPMITGQRLFPSAKKNLGEKYDPSLAKPKPRLRPAAIEKSSFPTITQQRLFFPPGFLVSSLRKKEKPKREKNGPLLAERYLRYGLKQSKKDRFR